MLVLLLGVLTLFSELYSVQGFATATHVGSENHIQSIRGGSSSCYEGTYRVDLPPYGKCSGFRSCEVGYFCSNGIKRPCPAGFYAASTGLPSNTCSGACPAGHYCPEATVTPIACGNATVYCPAGSKKPTPVPDGFYTLGPDDIDRQKQFDAVKCPVGYYCTGGLKEICPGGVFGSAEGLQTADCSGKCAPGFYCPPGSTDPYTHPCNYNNPNEFCPEGSDHPLQVFLRHYSTDNMILKPLALLSGGEGAVADGGDSGSTAISGSVRERERENALRRMKGRGGGYASQELCPQGSYCIDGIRYLCPAGRFGDRTGMINSSCTGPCQVGFYCPPGSVSKIQVPCGSHHQFCPHESAYPTPVSQGHYTFYLNEEFTNIEVTNFTYTSPVPLTNGSSSYEVIESLEHQSIGVYQQLFYYNSMRAGNQTLCEPGYYCLSDGIRRKCPVGRYGETSGLSNALCTGPCPAGYYCPEGTYDPTAHECGNATYYCPVGAKMPHLVRVGYFTAGGLTPNISTSERKCPPGSYCPGDGLSRLCAPGRYGSSFGLSDENCTGACLPGYYCPPGSTMATQTMCGDPSLYCPPMQDSYPYGNSLPTPVETGFYSIGGGGTWEDGGEVLDGRAMDDNGYTVDVDGNQVYNAGANRPNSAPAVATRTGQKIAERGYYALKGLRYICPAGRYGAIEGLSTPDCSGYCDKPGYYCPPGSTSPYQKACGGPNVICPAGTVVPLMVRKGFYTSDPQLEQCPPGMYRNWTGLAKNLALEDVPNSPYGSKSSVVSTSIITPYCQQCPYGTYKSVSGDDISLCIACNASNSISTPNRVQCQCTTVLQSQYAAVFNAESNGCDIIPADDVAYVDESVYQTNTSFTRYEEFECEPGYYCVNGLRFVCAAGYYNSRPRLQGTGLRQITSSDNSLNYFETAQGNIDGTLTSWDYVASRDDAQCEGLCAPGYYCPEGSTSRYAVPCGSAEYICPEGSPVPRPVSGGYYSNEDVSELYRTEQFPCPVGQFCVNSKRYPCPRGTYTDEMETTNPECKGPCEAGYYCRAGSNSSTQFECGGADVICPRGSHSPLPVLNGFYSVHTGMDENSKAFWDPENRTQSAQIPCEPGYYCIAGVKYPCPPGTFGWRYGLNTSTCSGLCAPGYYCPSYLHPPPPGVPSHTVFPRKPHTSAAEYECGGSPFVCPKGSWFPKQVGGGNYSIGGGVNNRTRTGEKVCLPGNYCVDGIMQPCPKGKFGRLPGLAVTTCSGWCPAAYSCPLGTADPIRCEGQTYSVGAQWDCAPCPGDNNFTLPCHDSRYCCFQGG